VSGDARGETVSYRARFDECGPDGRLRSAGLLRWAQDAAWVHSERLGFGREWYAERGLWWLVRCAELDVSGGVALGERAAVTTRVTGWRKVWARRRTQIVRESGAPAALAITDWVLTDARGLPTRVPPEFGEVFGTVETFQPGRVVLEPTPAGAVALPFTVRDHEIDPLAHANNAVYVDWLEEAARAIGVEGLRRFRLEFLLPAARGAEVMSRVWRRDGGIGYRLEGPGEAQLMRATAAA
jgi:acyl-CoA thioesterase FadM